MTREDLKPSIDVEEKEHGESIADEYMHLGTLIAGMDDGMADPVDLADDVIDVVLASSREQARAYLRHAIWDEVRRSRRHSVRAAEQNVGARMQAGADPSAARKALSGTCFWTPDDGLVPWLEATAKQHSARAAYQRERALPLIEDAKRHETAALDILAAGVECLGDLTAERA